MNCGDMEKEDFMEGDFGKLSLGEDYKDGEIVNVMAKGVIKNGELNVKDLAIVSMDSEDSEDSESEDDSMDMEDEMPHKKKANMAVKKIMKGEEDETY